MRDSRKFLKFTSNIVKLPKLCFGPSPPPPATANSNIPQTFPLPPLDNFSGFGMLWN